MAGARRGLGRGLSALIEEARGAGDASGAEGVMELPIEALRPNAGQPRRAFNDADMEELAASVRTRGILQPILVRPSPDRRGEYQIVAGERRWRAAQMARLHAVPVIVRAVADDEIAVLALIENIQRADLNAMEEARAYADLMERFDGKAASVAEAVGKSRAHVANTLRLLRLPAVVRERVETGELSAGHARAIATAADPAALAATILGRSLSVRQAEALARQAGPSGAGKTRRPTAKDADTLALEQDVSEALGLGVEIADKGGAGEVRVRYGSIEQLDEVCRRLSRR